MAKRATKSLSEQGEALKKEGGQWLERVEAAWKREDVWAKDAEKAVKAFTNESAGTGKLYDYNILHANTETIVPAIINSPPVPDIRRRFGDDDPIAKQLADIVERAISVQVDDGKLEVELEGQAQDAFLAGRGVIRLRFYADAQETESSALEEAEDAADGEDAGPDREAAEAEPGEVGGDSAAYAGGDPAAGPPAPGVSNERICFEAVSWRDYQHGPAKRWEDRPWESYRHVMQREDLTGFADDTLVTSQTEPGGKAFGDDDTLVYEIWNKPKHEVVFVSDKGVVLKRLPDPLGLSNFFPSSRPVQPIELVGRLMPVTPFSIYERLADELDILTKRIRVITAAMKVKGAFIGGIANDIMAFATADDNELVAVNGAEVLAQTPGGLNGALTWWPVEKFQPVLAELFKNRDLTKQAIYEITGISDIVRGASEASETATAQQIKSRWGALRIQKMQRMMERSARDLFVMMSEIIPVKFSNATLETMTGIPINIGPQDTAEQVQQKQQLQALMKKKLTTYYRVDVESDSTVRADLTQKKAEMNEFLAGSASFFQGMAPVLQEGGPEALEGVLEIYAAAARNFDLGKSAEDAVENMVATAKAKAEEAKANPQPPPPDPEMVKASAQAGATQQDAKSRADAAQQDLQIKGGAAKAKSEADAAQYAHDEQMRQADRELKDVQVATAKVNLAKAGADLLTPKTTAHGETAPQADPGEVAALISRAMPDHAPEHQQRHAEAMNAIQGGNAGIAQALAEVARGQAALAAALTRPKSITTPDGRTYTATVN